LRRDENDYSSLPFQPNKLCPFALLRVLHPAFGTRLVPHL
jgi:hypothetical protein